MSRPRFTLRTLLIVVAISAVGFRLRPGHADPRTVQEGTSKAWVYWSCGSKANVCYSQDAWFFDPAPESHENTVILFDGDGRVEKVLQWPRSINGFWEKP